MKGEVDFNRSFLLDQNPSEELKKRVDDYFSKMIKMQGKNRLGFKITGPSRISFLKNIFPDAKFIWIKRNFFAVLHSFLNVNFWKNKGYAQLWFYDAFTNQEKDYALKFKNDPIMLTAIQLKKIINITEYEINQKNPDIITVQYESFLDNPINSLKFILDFSELPYDKACEHYIRKNHKKKNKKDYRKLFGFQKYTEIYNLLQYNSIFT